MRISDWSSDVCSSDLPAYRHRAAAEFPAGYAQAAIGIYGDRVIGLGLCKACRVGTAAPDYRGVGGIDHDGVVAIAAIQRGVGGRSTDDDIAEGRAEIGRESCGERVCQDV